MAYWLWSGGINSSDARESIYHACWYPRSSSHQGISRHGIDSIGWTTCMIAPFFSLLLNKIQVILSLLWYKGSMYAISHKYYIYIIQNMILNVKLYFKTFKAIMHAKHWVWGTSIQLLGKLIIIMGPHSSLKPYTPGADVLIMLQMKFLVVFLIHICSFANFG